MSETRRDKDGRCIPERDMEIHGSSFHCSCGQVIHESIFGAPQLRDQLWLLKQLAKKLRHQRDSILALWEADGPDLLS